MIRCILGFHKWRLITSISGAGKTDQIHWCERCWRIRTHYTYRGVTKPIELDYPGEDFVRSLISYRTTPGES